MRAHRGVDAARDSRVLQHLAVDAFAHAVQALQFKRRTLPRCHAQDGGDGASVVRGELRVDGVGRVEQGLCTSQVAHIGVRLLREHRVGRQAQFLSALDLGVPIGTLDQAAHEFESVLPPQRRHVFDEFHRTRLVGLQRQTKTLPLRVMLRHELRQRLEHVEREFKPVDLFRVDGQVQVGGCRTFAQGPHAGNKLAHHTIVLCIFVARVQRAELDRDAVVLARCMLGIGRARNRRDGVLVTRQVPQRVGVGAGALAQHVETEAQVGLALARRRRLLHALLDGLAQHKLAAQQLHRTQRGGHHGLSTELGHQAGLVARFGQELLRHGDRGGRQARQSRIGCPIEVGASELVGGQGNRRLCVRHAQQRLRQSHEGQTFGAGDRVLLEQALHGPERRRVIAHRAHPGGRLRGRSGPVERTLQRAQAVSQHAGFGAVREGQAVGGARHEGLRNSAWFVDLRMFMAYRPNFSPKQRHPTG